MSATKIKVVKVLKGSELRVQQVIQWLAPRMRAIGHELPFPAYKNPADASFLIGDYRPRAGYSEPGRPSSNFVIPSGITSQFALEPTKM